MINPFDANRLISDTINTMRVTRQIVFLVLAMVLPGCAWNHPQPRAATSHPASSGWDGNTGLTLDQIQPRVTLGRPATEPVGRPSVESLVLYAQARDATLRGQPAVAIDCLQKAIALDPFRFQLRYDLGWAYVNATAGDDTAVGAFEKAARLKPDDIDLQTELGQLYFSKANYPAAIDHLRFATQTTDYMQDDGRAAVADLLLAQALKDAGYDRAALNQYTVLLNRFSHPSLSLQQNPQLAYRLERPETVFVQIGELLEKHGEYAQAIEAFRPAVDRDPDEFQLQARYARDLALDGRRDPALEKAVDLIVRDRASPPSLQVLHDVCQDLNLPDGQVATLRKLSRQRPGDQAVLFALTDTLLSAHRSIEARELLESAWQKSPSDIQLTRRLFAIDKNENAVAAAAKLLIAALLVNPDALHNYAPLWAELLRPGQTNRLTLAMLTTMQVAPRQEASKQFWIAMTAADENRPAVERSALESASAPSPPFAPAFRLLLGVDLVRSDWSDAQKSDAADRLSALAKAGGDLPLSLEITGRLLVFEKKSSQATDVFSQAVAAGGKSPDLMLALADAAKGIGRDPVYEQQMWKLISESPLFEDGYIELFQYYANSDIGSAEQATKVLATWLVSDPQSVSARISQAQVDIQQGQTRDAEQELSRLFDEDPDDPDLFGLMRQFYNQAGRIDALIGKLENQRAAHPRDTDLVGRLVLLYSEQKRDAEAIRLLDSTRGTVADDADLLYALTFWYNQLNQRQTAQEVLLQVVQLDPTHAGASNDLGFEWADEGKNLPRAEQLIRIAVAAEPDNESFLDSLGWVLYKRGQYDQAQKYLLEAIGPAAFPDPVVLDHLGDTLYRLSKTDDARETWQRSLKGLGDSDTDRDDTKQLRLQLLEKIRQVEAKKPVDVAKS